MTGNNPRSYYIAAIFFALFGVFLAWKTWTSYSATDESSVAALYLVCTILCFVEVLLLIRNGKRRAKGIPPKRRF